MGKTNWHRGTYPPTLIEAIALHTLLLNLGYSMKDNMFMILVPEGISVVLQAEGEEAQIRIDSPELPIPEMVQLWKSLIANWNTGGTFSTEEKDAICNTSRSFTDKVNIIARLLLAGFRPPLHNRD